MGSKRGVEDRLSQQLDDQEGEHSDGRWNVRGRETERTAGTDIKKVSLQVFRANIDAVLSEVLELRKGL